MAAYTMKKIVFVVLQLLLVIAVVCGLYEDQIGKFDWKQKFIGNVKFSHVEAGTSRRFIFVATEANVLAGLGARTGQIAWRQVFKRGPGGAIDALLYNNEDLITLSGGGRTLRSWDPSSGYLRWEAPTTTQAASQKGVQATLVEGEDGSVVAVLAGGTLYIHNVKDGAQISVQALPNSEAAEYKWLQEEEDLLHVVGIVQNSHISVATYHITDETITKQMVLPAAWSNSDTRCTVVSCNQLVCVDQVTNALQLAPFKGASMFTGSPLQTLGLTASSLGATVTTLHPSSCQSSEFVLKLTTDHHVLLTASNGQVQIKKDLDGVHAVTGLLHGEKTVMAVASLNAENSVMDIKCYIDGEESSQEVEISGSHGIPEKMTLMMYEKRDHQLGFRALVQTADHALMLLYAGQMTWHREEALPGAIAVEMVDLPVSDTEAKFEDEFGGDHEESIGMMFLRRLSTQFAQLQSFAAHLQRRFQHGGHHEHAHHEMATPSNKNGREGDDEDDDEYYLTRDDFNLHKILLIVTKSGKIYGLDSKDGSIVWSYFLPELQPFEVRGQSKLLLFVQRTTAHFPHPPQCTVIGKHKTTGHGMLYSFNPITGKPSSEDSTHGTVLPYNIKQATLLALTDDDFLKVIVLMDTENKIHTYPSSAASTISEHLDSIFLFTGSTQDGAIEGFKLSSVEEMGGFHSDLVWNIQLPSTQSIAGMESKRQTEHVHSQGRVLGDRSVLYKYLNPNLVAIVTEGKDGGAKAQIQVFLVDAVTGNILFSTDHKRCSGPVHIVHAENWVVYHYWNTRHRRNEMTVLELYEGKTQKNSTAFSSLDPPDSPIVERQSYIIPSAIQAMAATFTERGITQKHLLLVLSSGGILSLPKRMLDPRRPLVPTAEHREEGLIPYLPEIGIPHQSMINYNQTLVGIEAIHTSPAGLESTCLVLAYGLDYYFTRVTPSKLFDVLKEDFDYMFISAVLLGLVIAAYITRRLSAMRSLRQAWK